MRYEISQEQYKDFLNCLNRTQQNYRTGTNISFGGFSNHYVMSNNAIVSIRNGITCLGTGHGTVDPITFYCDYNGNRVFDEPSDGQNIACNFLNWEDGLAYLDWAGLRPMTEFEYEKACRGPNNPDANDFPWGTALPTETSLVILMKGKPSNRYQIVVMV
jgi:formylglycine-generating enzyme required for sulfatase activity